MARSTGTDNESVDIAQQGLEKLTVFLTPVALSGNNRSAAVGNEQSDYKENGNIDNCLDSRKLDKKK